VLLTALGIPLFLALGVWQWQRGQVRQADWDEFAHSNAPALEAGASSLARQPRYTRVRVRGQFDGERQFLLENISHGGAPGYQALTVLTLPDGPGLLVNRGWLPFSGYREQLPDLSLPAEVNGVPTSVTGRIAGLPVAGLPSGQAAPAQQGKWPRVASFPSMAQLESAYGRPLLPVVLLLDADSGPGYVRDWRPAGLPPERHIGYAVQWWCFALLLAGLFVGLNLKRSHD
jgi:surfeit locus 1 family protein